MSSLIDPDDYRDRIGTTTSTDFGTITRREIRRYARATEDENPLYFDVEYARDHGYDDLVAPPTFLAAIVEPGEGPPADRLREDGLDPDTGLDFPNEVIRMGGGWELSFSRYVTAGERITRETTIADIYQKESSRMGVLTFTVRDHEYYSDRGDLVLENRMTRIVGDRQ